MTEDTERYVTAYVLALKEGMPRTAAHARALAAKDPAHDLPGGVRGQEEDDGEGDSTGS